MEVVGNRGELLAQLIVLLLACVFALQLIITLLDNLLKVTPGVLKGFHGEPGVRVGSNLEGVRDKRQNYTENMQYTPFCEDNLLHIP